MINFDQEGGLDLKLPITPQKVQKIFSLKDQDGESWNIEELKGAVVDLMTLALFVTLAFWITLIVFSYQKPFPYILGFALLAGIIIYHRLQSIGDVELKSRVFVNMTVVLLLLVNFSCVVDHGLINTNTPWLLAIPIVTFFLGGIRLGIIWTLVVLTYLLTLVLCGNLGWVNVTDMEEVVDLFSSYLIISLFSFLFENVLEKFQRRLVRKNEELQKFVYVVSHDLRSPLTSTRGYVTEIQDSLKQGDIQPAMADLNKLTTLAENMGKMIDELLMLSRLNKEEYEKEVVDIGQLVKEVLANFQIQLEQKGFEVELTNRLPEIEVYKRPLMEVFNNLISNAIKFSEEGERPRIEIGCKIEPRECLFYVKDNGIGISPKEHPYIFNLLYRKGKKAGTGIGLSVVKEYVEMHGGKVWVETPDDPEPGGQGPGTVFWFSIPKN